MFLIYTIQHVEGSDLATLSIILQCINIKPNIFSKLEKINAMMKNSER